MLYIKIIIGILIVVLVYSLYVFLVTKRVVKRSKVLQSSIQPRDYEVTHTSGGSELKVLVTGDSSSVGVGGASHKDSYHYQFLIGQQQFKKIQVRNIAVSGAVAGDVINQIKLVNDNFDIIFVSVGGNDITKLTSKDVYTENLRRIMSLAQKKARSVVLITPGDFISIRLPYPLRVYLSSRSKKVSGWSSEAIKDFNNVLHIDLYKLEGDFFKNSPETYYGRDGFHPSPLGYIEWARLLQQKARGL